MMKDIGRFRAILPVLLQAVFWVHVIGCNDDATTFDADLASAIQTSLDEAIDQYRIPGAVISIIDPAGAKWTGTSGLANLETGTPITQDLKFRIGSLTKPFTAIVVLQLVDEGLIELDVPVGDYLPGLLTRGNDITIRLLLNMRSGLGSYGANPAFTEVYESNPGYIWTHEELVQYSNYTVFEPGENWQYNNANYFVLALLIEKMTGGTYENTVTSRIINPLGLDDTSVPATMDMPAPYAHGYMSEGDDTYDRTFYYPVNFAWASGVIVSNASDMLVFFDAYLSGRLLSKEMFLEQWTLLATGRGNLSYGLCAADINGSYGHTGSYHGIYTSILLHRKGYDFVVLCNGKAEGGDGNSSAEKVYDKIISDVGI